VDQYYFYGFRATAVYLDSTAVDRLRRDPAVAWIDSSTGIMVPSSEVTGWSFIRHRFDQAQSAGFFGDGEIRVAIIGDGVQCSLADIPCGTGVNITGDPNVDGGHTDSHETRIASIIAAAVGNGIGIKGGAPYVSLHSIRAFGVGGINCQDLAEALDVAAAYWELDADIINVSYSTPENPCGSLVDLALAGAVAGADAIVVTSAGNEGVGSVEYPGSNSLTLAVSGMTQSPFKIAPLSNYGREIDIAAGGWGVATLDRAGAVSGASGTSFAVPHVVAALALLYAQRVALYVCKPSAGEAKAALFQNTQNPDLPFMATWYGAGALDVYAALTSDWLQGAEVCPHEIPDEL
jgi:subtilisin family serine protease